MKTLFVVFSVFATMQKLPELDSRWNEIGPYVLDINDTVAQTNQLDVITKARKYYLKDEPLTKDNIYSLVEVSDFEYVL